jgi:hypothetical protein
MGFLHSLGQKRRFDLGCPTSGLPQSADIARPARLVRFVPCVDGSGLARAFFTVLQHWSLQPCVRPFDAVHMTAGHNALRGSGPDQNLAFDNAMARVGCPDRRIDRLCITCCSPSQPSHHAGCPARSRFIAQARRVPCIARPWPSWPRPFALSCWQAL